MSDIDTNGEDFPGEIDPANAEVTVDDFAEKISANWRKMTDSILAVGRLCAAADTKLKMSEKTNLLARLPFNAPTFSKLVRIGRDQRIMEPAVQSNLPPNYTTIYSLTRLTDQQLEDAVTKGLVHPKMRRADVPRVPKPESRRRQRERRQRERRNRRPKVLKVSFRDASGSLDATKQRQLKDSLITLAESFGIDVDFSDSASWEDPPLLSPSIVPDQFNEGTTEEAINPKDD